jgi:hypothetical protein
MPDIDYDSNTFSYDGTLNSDEYINMMKKEDNIGNALKETLSNNFEDIGKYASFGAVGKKNVSVKYRYNQCEANILDIEKKEIDEEYIESKVKSQEQFILIIQMNPDNMDEDFEVGIKDWKYSHENISNYKGATDEWKLIHEPSRNLRIEIENGVYNLINCKIAAVLGGYGYGILIEKVITDQK